MTGQPNFDRIFNPAKPDIPKVQVPILEVKCNHGIKRSLLLTYEDREYMSIALQASKFLTQRNLKLTPEAVYKQLEILNAYAPGSLSAEELVEVLKDADYNYSRYIMDDPKMWADVVGSIRLNIEGMKGAK